MASNKVTVRRGVPTDASAVTSLYLQLVNTPSVSVLPDQIAQLSNDPNTAFFVTECNGKLNGTALVSLCADIMFGTQPYAIVENIIVDAGSRSQGVGEALMFTIESFCRDSDCSKIMLLSASEREQAHQFFDRMGFDGHRKRGFVKYRRNFGTK